MFGVPWNGDTIAPPDMNRYFKLASADLVVPNQEAWRLLWDFEVLKQIIDELPGNTVCVHLRGCSEGSLTSAIGSKTRPLRWQMRL